MEKMDAFKGDKSVFLPKKTFKDKMTLGKGKDQIDLYYFGRAHTNGDALVVFPALRVMHAGDVFAGKTTPIIDANNGGSAVEYGKTLAKARIDHQERGHHHHRAQPADDAGRSEGVRGTSTTTSSRGCRTRSRPARPSTPPRPSTSCRTQYKGYTVSTFLGGIKNNIQVAYTELGAEVVLEEA